MSVKAIVAAFFCSHGGTPLFSYLSVNITIICILSIPYFIYPLQCFFDLSSIFYVLVQMLSNFRALCHFTCKGRHFFPGNFVKTALFSPAHPSAFCRGPPLFPKGASVNTRVAATSPPPPPPPLADLPAGKIAKGPPRPTKDGTTKGLGSRSFPAPIIFCKGNRCYCSLRSLFRTVVQRSTAPPEIAPQSRAACQLSSPV